MFSFGPGTRSPAGPDGAAHASAAAQQRFSRGRTVARFRRVVKNLDERQPRRRRGLWRDAAVTGGQYLAEPFGGAAATTDIGQPARDTAHHAPQEAFPEDVQLHESASPFERRHTDRTDAVGGRFRG